MSSQSVTNGAASLSATPKVEDSVTTPFEEHNDRRTKVKPSLAKKAHDPNYGNGQSQHARSKRNRKSRAANNGILVRSFQNSQDGMEVHLFIPHSHSV